MTSGSFDGHSQAEIQDLRRRLEFLKKAQEEIGGHRSQFLEEMNQRVLILEQNQRRLLQLFEEFAAQAISLKLVTPQTLENGPQGAPVTDADVHTLTPFLQSCGFRETPSPTSLYSSLSRLAEDVALPPDEFLQHLESEAHDDPPPASQGHV